jgi:3-hydroxyacyl-CoA dehydrogenase / enoyl-CoA hydratase / 3-hydroxybutyryl-CoA epimerase
MTEDASGPAAGPRPSGAFRLDREEDLALVWFDYPGEKVNKFSSWVVEEFERLVGELAGSDARKVLFLSAKERNFIAGADVSEFTQVTSASQAADYIRYGQSVLMKWAALPQVTFAVINGSCLGGGTELALNCDYRLMSDDPKAIIGLPEVKLGILPAWSGSTRLPRLIGLPAALDMILNGRTIDSRRAKKSGLVDEVLPAAVLLDSARRYAAGRKESKRVGRKGRTHFYLEGNPLARKFVFGKARDAVIKQTGGHYPAPLEAIEVMKRGLARGVDAGLEAEADAASRLIMGDVAQNLVRLFFMMEDAKKDTGPAPRKIASAGVLGAGLMGGGIAQLIADKADVNVRMKDINWDALAGGMKAAAKVWKKRVERRRMKKGEMLRKLARITTTTDWSGFRTADVVVEAVVENLAVKQQVLREFEGNGKGGAIFATNTSTIPITAIATAAALPENVVGMHFFSPVDRMPLVEVIAGEKTSPEVVSTIAAFGRKLGKTVVVCKDGPGFIVNRILGPYINEAALLVQEGSSIDSVDKAMLRFGMPMGPLALLDEVGIDVAGKAAHVLMESFGERMEAATLIDAMLGDQRFGKKNGRGVYLWKGGKRTAPDPDVYRIAGVGSPRAGDANAMVERMLLVMINEASRIAEERIASSAQDIDLAMIMGTGFPPFRGGLLRYADSLGIPYLLGRFDDLSSRLGKRFAPAEPIRRMGAEGTSFYERYGKGRG